MTNAQNNQTAFLRFKELLETRQTAHDPDRDIRAHVLSLTKRKVGFGYIESGIKSAFGANLQKLFSNFVAVDQAEFITADVFVSAGAISSDATASHKGAVRLFNTAPRTSEILLIEASFLATTHSWVHSFKEKDPSYACLGYVYDDIAQYFMADYPNRLIRKLNSDDTPSAEELARADAAMQRIVTQRISKYNAQPMHAPTMTEGYARRVLVCDQAYADASTVYGKVGDAEFDQMLLAAITENPDAEILVKTHPDTAWTAEKRSGYYSHLQSTGRVRLLRDPVNPYALFDLVDTVYVGTSQMGLEALFAGKKVVTFGAPFYAGWGLTDDRQVINHRHRQRSLAEIFHYFYIWYTIYHLPDGMAPARIEDVLSYIEHHRPYPLPPTPKELAAPPKVSVIIPVYGVEDYIEECLTSIQRQTLREIEIITINDASPDNSQAIIDRLAVQDPRIKPILLAKNIGQGFARNHGLDAAQGEYVWFIDSDDIMPTPDFLKKITQKADAGNLDMVRGRKAVFSDKLGKPFSPEHMTLDKSESYFPDGITRREMGESDRALFSWNCWIWLYRRNYLNELEIRFDLPQMEERPFVIKSTMGTCAIDSVDDVAVAYRRRDTSTMRRKKSMEDVHRFLTNFRICIPALLINKSSVKGVGNIKKFSDLVLTQFIHAFFGTWPYQTIITSDLDTTENKEYLETFAEALLAANFRPDDLRFDWKIMRDDMRDSGAYHLIIAALRVRKFDWIKVAVEQQAVEQDRLYAELLAEPADPDHAEFQSVLSRYARNARVKTAASLPVLASAGSDQPRPRIIIHIGATKTGSTFIQHILEQNRPALLRKGIWVPEVGLFWQASRPHKQAGHSQFTRAAVRKDPTLRQHIESGLALMQGKIHTIILSSEAYFLQERANLLVDYFADYPVEMIVYLRRQDEWANSQYCEFVAGGAMGRVSVPIADWLQLPETRDRLDYRQLLERWRTKLGPERMHVRIYGRTGFVGGNLLDDFADAVTLPDLLQLPEPDRHEQNDARLSTAHVELLRMFNSRPFASREAYLNFVEEVGTVIANWRQENGHPLPKPWMLSIEQANAIMMDQLANNVEIAKEYLGREEAMFGPRGDDPTPVPLFAEEITLIESIYRRHAPPEPAATKLQPAAAKKPSENAPLKARTATAKKQPATVKPIMATAVKPTPGPLPANPEPVLLAARVVNYGLFGWRFWLLTPIIALLYVHRSDVNSFRAFLADPSGFARQNWATKKPLMVGLLYPDNDPLGPFGVFRVWVPIMRWMTARTGREDMMKVLEKDPVLFARSMRHPLRRLVGRIMLPAGEVTFASPADYRNKG